MNTDTELELIRLRALKAHIEELIVVQAIGSFGVRNINGADVYKCPACGASFPISGYCGFIDSIDFIPEHREDCGFIKLQNLLKEFTEEEEKEN
jgi:hypothetical protein